MSVVVGVVTDTEVVIAADTALTGNFTTFGESKIFRVGDAVVGMAGNPLWGTFIRGYTEPLTDRSSIEAFAQAWWEWVQARNLEKDEQGGHFLVATSEGLFEVCSTGAVCVADLYTAIGSGESIAIGALWAARGGIASGQGDVIAFGAVSAAIYHHPTCGGTVELMQVEREKV